MYNHIDEIISEAESAGSHFFSESAMAWFDSIVEPAVYGGRYFITSEQDQHRAEHPRQWTIRVYNGGNDIKDASGFCEFNSHEEALSAVKKILISEWTK